MLVQVITQQLYVKIVIFTQTDVQLYSHIIISVAIF